MKYAEARFTDQRTQTGKSVKRASAFFRCRPFVGFYSFWTMMGVKTVLRNEITIWRE